MTFPPKSRMDREAHERFMAELLARDQARRALAEPEIARKEARLAEARARLAELNGDIERLEAEIEQARSDAAEGEA